MSQKSGLCDSCREVLPRTMFIPRKSAKRGFSTICIDCTAKSTPAKLVYAFKSRLKKYGLSKNQYEAILEDQNHQCAICQVDDKPLVIDHCHTTGKVRGLLCGSCNTGLGSFRDNIETLGLAISYLITTRESRIA